MRILCFPWNVVSWELNSSPDADKVAGNLPHWASNISLLDAAEVTIFGTKTAVEFASYHMLFPV